jgi:hypothetical protein
MTTGTWGVEVSEGRAAGSTPTASGTRARALTEHEIEEVAS